MAENTTSAYIDIEKLTAPEFSPYAHANRLILSTNNPTDPSIDLTTPLSKVLFDLQEIDANIHTLTSRDALEILHYTSTQNDAAARILARVEEERTRLNASYTRLEAEISSQYDKAVKARLHAERSHQVLKLGRDVQRVLMIARQFETLLKDSGLQSQASNVPSLKNSSGREDHRMLLEAGRKLLEFHQLMSAPSASDLGRITMVRDVRGRVFEDGEALLLDYARRIIREFAVKPLAAAVASTFQEVEDSKARFASAAHILYLVSPVPQIQGSRLEKKDFEPEYLLRALESYLQVAVTSSSAGIARALGQLPTLSRALGEVSARCQNIIALETLLRNIHAPEHPSLSKGDRSKAVDHEKVGDNTDTDDESVASGEEELKDNLLQLLLESLDTSSLPSFFWRSLASQLATRVQEILNRGGTTARTLRNKVADVRIQIRDCVLEGSKMPSSMVTSTAGGEGRDHIVGNWEREAAVMVGSVIGPINR